MTVDDAYAELGLPPGADLAQAKAAWRSLVSRWHPDRNGHAGALARMQRINRALEQIRAAGESKVAPPTERSDPEPAAVPTVHHRVTLTLEEAASGCIKLMQGTTLEACTPCAGTGHAVAPQECATCAGKGQVHERTWFGWYDIGKPCADCNATGSVRPPCPACDGRGKTERTRYRMSVRLPAYTRDGDTLHVPAARGKASVALDIHIAVRPHASLVFDDTDGSVRCEVPVDGFGWIANRTVDVPTLQGMQPLQLQRGQVMYRLAGQGFPPRAGGKPAEQIVIVVPKFPEQLSRKQERLLEQLAQSTAKGGAG